MKKMLITATVGLLFWAGQVAVARADTITTNFGFSFYVTGSWGLPVLDSDQKIYSYRFTSPEEIDVDHFVFNISAWAGSPEVHISIRSDDGGNPSGTVLAETTFTPTVAGGHRYYGEFDDSANLEAGTVYHVVRTVTNGSADDSITLGLLGGAGSDFQNSAKTGQPDPWQTSVYSVNGGATWTANPQTGSSLNLIALGSADGSAVGMPHNIGHGSSHVGGTTVRGQHFVYDGLTGDKVTNVTVLVRNQRGGAAAEDDLRMYLMTAEGTILSSNVFLSAGFTNTTYDLYSLTLTDPVALTSGEAYRLAFESTDSTAASYNLSVRGTEYTNMWDATFQGTNSFMISTTTGNLGNLAREGGSTHIYDMNFNLGIEVIPEPTTVLLGALGLLLLLNRRRQRR